MGIEYELKFKGDPAVMADFPENRETIRMQTTYYDTPSGALSVRRYMLRKREENDISVCTLKTSVTGNLRGEWEVVCPDIRTAVPELCKLGCPADLESLSAEGLIPVCGARFIRKTVLLDLSGCTAELAFDEGILFGKGKEVPLCEIELELKSGNQEALDTFAESFAAKYNLLPEAKSKFARALALCEE